MGEDPRGRKERADGERGGLAYAGEVGEDGRQEERMARTYQSKGIADRED